jgi:hypothetical protein
MKQVPYGGPTQNTSPRTNIICSCDLALSICAPLPRMCFYARRARKLASYSVKNCVKERNHGLFRDPSLKFPKKVEENREKPSIIPPCASPEVWTKHRQLTSHSVTTAAKAFVTMSWNHHVINISRDTLHRRIQCGATAHRRQLISRCQTTERFRSAPIITKSVLSCKF